MLISIETHKRDFPGGGLDPLSPPLDPHMIPVSALNKWKNRAIEMLQRPKFCKNHHDEDTKQGFVHF